jgi:hypothetical protein
MAPGNEASEQKRLLIFAALIVCTPSLYHSINQSMIGTTSAVFLITAFFHLPE